MQRRQAIRSKTSPLREKPAGYHVSEACGCTIRGKGTQADPWKIAYCPEHVSAYELFNKAPIPMCCPECQEVECDPECSDPRGSRAAD
jgi:hypothetical protein